MEQSFKFEDQASRIDVFTDSDWAGDLKTRKSTSGGIAMFRGRLVKGWSSTQRHIALSSGEAELYAMSKGLAEGIGLQSYLRDLGIEADIAVHVDSNASIGIASRRGIGKMRHIQVKDLWMQQKLEEKVFELIKIPGSDNVSDICTKPVDHATMHKHMHKMGFEHIVGTESEN